MENDDELYAKYYSAYKSGYDTDYELNEAKKKKFDHNQFKLIDKTDKELKLDEETKDLKLTALLKWLSSKNDFNEATKLINDIRADTNNAKTSLGHKKVFKDLEKLINDINNNKVKKEGVAKRMKKSIYDSWQVKQKESTIFQNKMIYVIYYLFNSLGLGEKPLLFN